ncbi:hypothetical protein KAI87_10600 [Myxococcota bacterium]|nr:hypothetical protein [Myxococcota bacterium]
MIKILGTPAQPTLQPQKPVATAQKPATATSPVIKDQVEASVPKTNTAPLSATGALSATDVGSTLSPQKKAALQKIEISTPFTGKVGDKNYLTAGGTKVEFVNGMFYKPTTSPAKIIPADKKLYQWLTTREKGDWASSNLQNSDKAQIKSEIRGYLKAHPKVLRKLKIKNPQQLTPKQAFKLAAQITQDSAQYDRTLTDGTGLLNRVTHFFTSDIDNTPIEDFIASKGTEDAVCRNYTAILQGVFESLQEMQEPKSQSQLNNSYVKNPRGPGHVWSALYTVQPDGVVAVTQTDATWNDSYVDGFNEDMDFTFGVRQFNLLRYQIRETGWRPVQKLTNKFGAWAISSKNAMAMLKGDHEATKPGGINTPENLSRAFDELALPAQVEAWDKLSWDAKSALKDYRAKKGLTPILTKNFRGN